MEEAEGAPPEPPHRVSVVAPAGGIVPFLGARQPGSGGAGLLKYDNLPLRHCCPPNEVDVRPRGGGALVIRFS